MPKYVLSVDGGGIRGIIPAIILAEIEHRTNKRCDEIFDLMAGTSTGGIVVAGLCKNTDPIYTADDLVNLYLENGETIFQTSFWRRSLTWVCGSLYPSDNLEAILDKYFGESTCGEVSTNLLITSYDVHNGDAFFFKNWKTPDLKLKDALRATTAAPTIFEPICMYINEKKHLFVDGGVFANNPAACAYANSLKLFPGDDIIMLSIGTGRNILSLQENQSMGKLEWIKPLVNIMFESGLDCVNYQMRHTLGKNYIRIQTQLKVASPDLDDTQLPNLSALQEEAELMMKDNRGAFDNFCNMIS